jgi:hypothetical protein
MKIPYITEKHAKKLFSAIENKYNISSNELFEGKFSKRFNQYLNIMAKLENEEGDYEKALQRAIEKDFDHRVKIDLFTFEMLKTIGIDIRQILGKKIYQSILDEINVLSSIMDTKNKTKEIRDKGKRNLEYIFQKKLQDF